MEFSGLGSLEKPDYGFIVSHSAFWIGWIISLINKYSNNITYFLLTQSISLKVPIQAQNTEILYGYLFSTQELHIRRG